MRFKLTRFQCGKQIASCLGLVPVEDSSGNRRRPGHITKQGKRLTILPPKISVSLGLV